MKRTGPQVPDQPHVRTETVGIEVSGSAEELGYHPDNAARLLARGRSRTLGVMVTVHQSFQADLVEGSYPEAERLGYDVLLSATAPTRDEAKAVEAMLSQRCEALILLGPNAERSALDEFGRRAVVAVVGRRLPGVRVDSIHTADTKGIRQAVDHLVDLGHRRANSARPPESPSSPPGSRPPSALPFWPSPAATRRRSDRSVMSASA